MSVTLDQVVPWGRSRREYELMFSLSPADLDRGILDCGGGPASFNAELSSDGHRVVSIDPIYGFNESQIRGRFDAAGATIIRQMKETPDSWTWGVHRNLDDLYATRCRALELFLADFSRGLREGRYLEGGLPELPFADGEFGLALSSHLLFLYSDLLNEEFHIRSVLELARVAQEIRIFPLLTLKRELSPHIKPVRAAFEARGWSSEIVPAPYELQRGGNEMLVAKRV